METFKFAIDLGTTNSLIAKNKNGTIEIFKNPYGLKETLPSVVGYRGERILIGDKAKEYIEKDPGNVFSNFKRKMGTSDTYLVPNSLETITPINLSSTILKELKTFVRTGEQISSVIITIPASFDTIQSNATKQAGLDAGFKEVSLLQEPIAACLASANRNDLEENCKWLVYDFGGGTFDVAIVTNTDTELKVADHKGDNFLGGMDFDRAIVEKIILPKIYETGKFNNLKSGQQSNSKEFQKTFYILLEKAEDAKKTLSSSNQSFLDFDLINDDNLEQDFTLEISQKELNKVIQSKIQLSISLVQELLSDNNLTNKEIDSIVLVGGTTYIPLIRELLTDTFNIPLDTSNDPTNSIVIGGAYYAGTKISSLSNNSIHNEKEISNTPNKITIKTSYLKSSKETEEMILGVFTGDTANHFYRIIREDKGYDSGLKKIENNRFTENVRLNPKTINRFNIEVFDYLNNKVETNSSVVEIIQGIYNISGQPLPNDICIEVDDELKNRTKLDVIFEKNDILPLKKTIYKEVSKNLFKGGDDSLIINILEGNRYARPSTNQVIGCIEIKSNQLEADLVMGSDVEITLEISESRDITISSYLTMNDQKFKNIFSPSQKYVNLKKLIDETSFLLFNIKKDLDVFKEEEEYETAFELEKIKNEAQNILELMNSIKDNDATDLKYQLEERKRSIALKYDTIESGKKLTQIIGQYYDLKKDLAYELQSIEPQNNLLNDKFNVIIKNENSFISARSTYLIDNKINELNKLYHEINKNTPSYWVSHYYSLSNKDLSSFSDQKKAKKLFKNAEKALDRDNYTELEVVVRSLYHILPDEKEGKLKGTGLK